MMLKSKNTKKLITLLVIIAGIILGFIFIPRNHNYKVVDQYWERSIDIQKYQLITEEDWDVPADYVEILSRHSEIRSYRQVLDHYETETREVPYTVADGSHEECSSYYDNGDGTFSQDCYYVTDYTTEYRTETYEEPVYRQEPVYDTMYTYTVWRWEFDREVKSTDHTKSAIDGEYNLAVNERALDPNDKYYVTLQVKKDKQKKYKVNKEAYEQAYEYKTLYGKIVGFSFFPKLKK